MTAVPLPFTCQREAYLPDGVDAYNNPQPRWDDPVDTPCVWWTTETDTFVIVDSVVPVDYRDRFIVDGRHYEITPDTMPADYNHGPFGFSPNRTVVKLRMLDWSHV